MQVRWKASDKDIDEENAANAKAVNKNNWKETSGAQKKLRLSYKEQREWETIEGILQVWKRPLQPWKQRSRNLPAIIPVSMN